MFEAAQRKAEARRQAMEQERQRQVERESMERACREQARLEEERRTREERQRQAEQESRERARREQARIEKERRDREERQRQAERESRERERREQARIEEERRKRDAANSEWNLVKRLRIYEQKCASLRSNDVEVKSISFYDIPWPSFDDVSCVEDITEERVLAFVCHPLRSGTPAKSEMLRWHSDKFDRKVLPKVVEGDHREAARQAAGHVTRILTELIARTR
jgi:hypothetical protein